MNKIVKETTQGETCAFSRRTYSLSEAVREIGFFISKSKDVIEVAVNGRLNAAFREEIMVAVSRSNACAICNFTHHDFSLAAGVSESMLKSLETDNHAELDEKKKIAIDYAVAYSAASFGKVLPLIDKPFREAYTKQEQEDIELVTRFITLPNLTVNKTYDLESRINGEPVEGSNLIDEILISGVVYTVAPIMGVLVAYYRGESPLTVLIDYFKFSKQYEQEVVATLG